MNAVGDAASVAAAAVVSAVTTAATTPATTATATAATAADLPAPRRFAAHERRLMLSEPGIGDVVLTTLERHGFASLDALRHSGVERAVHVVCASQRSRAFANRQRALQRVLARAG